MNRQDNDKLVLIQLCIEKAHNALLTAKLNFENNQLEASQNRIYYSMFYSVLALGYLEGFVTSKHAQLLGWFNKSFIHERQIFDSKLFKIYKNAFDYRQKLDYSITIEPDNERIKLGLNDAKAFIEIIERYIKTSLAGE